MQNQTIIQKKKIKFKRIKGEDIKNKNIYDFVFSLGVIHHIPNYQKVCNNIFNSLKKMENLFVGFMGTKEMNFIF